MTLSDHDPAPTDQDPPRAGLGSYWPLLALLVCPASKLLVLGVGAAALGALTTGALVLVGGLPLVLGGLYLRSRRRCRTSVEPDPDR